MGGNKRKRGAKRDPNNWRDLYERTGNGDYLHLILAHPGHPEQKWADGRQRWLYLESVIPAPNDPELAEQHWQDIADLFKMVDMHARGELDNPTSAAKELARRRHPEPETEDPRVHDDAMLAEAATADRLYRKWAALCKLGDPLRVLATALGFTLPPLTLDG